MFYYCLREFRKSLHAVEGLISRSVTPSSPQSRNFTVTAMARSNSMKVAVLGAAGRTGTCLSLLLKQSCLIDELALYDKTEVTALALELNHIDTRCRVSSSTSGDNGLQDTLADAKIVVITAGQPYDTKKDSNDVVANANILLEYVPSIVTYCPRALLALATKPVNQLVPFVAEIYKQLGVFDHNRLFGITTLSCVRANTFAARIMGLEPECVMVPVIGGNCSQTCVPVFSQMKPYSEFTHEEISKLTYAVRMAEDEVARAYDGKGSSSLAMGFAAARFCISLCKALRDHHGVVECAYARSCVIPEVTYFLGPLEIGPCGIQKHLGVPPLTDQECKLLATAVPHLKEAITFGEVHISFKPSSDSPASSKINTSTDYKSAWLIFLKCFLKICIIVVPVVDPVTLALGPRATTSEICPPDPDRCAQQISGRMRETNNIPQPRPTRKEEKQRLDRYLH